MSRAHSSKLAWALLERLGVAKLVNEQLQLTCPALAEDSLASVSRGPCLHHATVMPSACSMCRSQVADCWQLTLRR